jgi:hypothetical protein
MGCRNATLHQWLELATAFAEMPSEDIPQLFFNMIRNQMVDYSPCAEAGKGETT